MPRVIRCLRPECGFETLCEEGSGFGLSRPCPRCGVLMVSRDRTAETGLDLEARLFLAQTLPWPLAYDSAMLAFSHDEQLRRNALAALPGTLARTILFLLVSDFLGSVVSADDAARLATVRAIQRALEGLEKAEDAHERLTGLVSELVRSVRMDSVPMVVSLSIAWSDRTVRDLAELAVRSPRAVRREESEGLARLAELIVARFAFISAYPWLRFSRCAEGPGPRECGAELYQGAEGNWRPVAAVADHAVPEGHMMIWDGQARLLLDIHPFVIVQNCPGCGEAGLFMLSGFDESGPAWRCVRSEITTPETPHRLIGGPSARRLRELFEHPWDFLTVHSLRHFHAPALRGVRLFTLSRGIVLAGKYRIEGIIQRGAGADVYRATDTARGTPVCLKVWPLRLLDAHPAPDVWVRASKALTGLRHAHLCPLYDHGYVGGFAYHVTGLASGWEIMGLKERLPSLDRLALPAAPAVAAEIIRQLAGVMQYLHANGLAWGQVTPENVLLAQDKGRYVVWASGVGLSTRHLPHPSDPAYLAPEQVESPLRENRKTDVYALGCLFYRLLTGRTPLAGETVVETLYRRATQAAEPLRDTDPDVPAPLRALVMRMLERDPAARPETAGAVVEEIERWQTESGLKAFSLREALGPREAADEGAGALLSLADTQKALGLSVEELDALVMQSKLSPSYLNGELMYPRAEVEALEPQYRKGGHRLSDQSSSQITPLEAMNTLGVSREEFDRLLAQGRLRPVGKNADGEALFDGGEVVLLKPELRPQDEQTAAGEDMIAYPEAMKRLKIQKRTIDKLVAQGKLQVHHRGPDVFFSRASVESVAREIEDLQLLASAGQTPPPGIFQPEMDDDSWFDSRLMDQSAQAAKADEAGQGGWTSPSDQTDVLQVDELEHLRPENMLTEAETCRELRVSPQQLQMLVEGEYLRRIPYGEHSHFLRDDVLGLSRRFSEVVGKIVPASRLRIRVVGGEALMGRRIALDMWELAKGAEWVMGRLPAVDLPLLDDSSLSRRHTALRYPVASETAKDTPTIPAALQVRDLGSQNGTYVGETLCKPFQWYDVPLNGVFRTGATTWIVERDTPSAQAGPEDEPGSASESGPEHEPEP